MKNYSFIKRSMVKVPLLLLITGLIAVSCKKKKEDDTVTTDDAADAIAYSMESGSGGYADQTKDCSEDMYMDVAYFNCGQTLDTTIVKNYNGTVTANYTFVRQYTLNCDSGISATCTGTYNGNFDGPRMSSNNSGTRSWTVTGLESTASVYNYSGSFTRTGTHTSKVRNQRVFNTTITVNTTNLQVDKSTYKIIGGTGTVSANCSVNGGGNYNFTGTLTYNSGGTATLTLNGTTYTITLY